MGAFYRDLITEALASHVLIYLSGVLSLLAGLAIVHRAQSLVRRLAGHHHRARLVDGDRRHHPYRGAARSLQTVAGTIYAGRAAIIAVAILCVALGGFLSFKGFSQ